MSDIFDSLDPEDLDPDHPLVKLVDKRLERLLTSGKLKLEDLPLAALQRRLEQRWQPDASILLQDGTVNREAIADNVLPDYPFRARGTGSSPAGNGAFTKYGYANEVHDPRNVYDAPNTRYIAPVTGYYVFYASLRIFSGIPADDIRFIMSLFVNNVEDMEMCREYSDTGMSNDAKLNGCVITRVTAGHEVHVRIFQNHTGNLDVGDTNSWFAGCLLVAM